MNEEFLNLYLTPEPNNRETIFPGSRAWVENFGSQPCLVVEPGEVQADLPGTAILAQAKSGVARNSNRRRKHLLGMPSRFMRRRLETIDEEPTESPLSPDGNTGKSEQDDAASRCSTNGPRDTSSEPYRNKYRDVFQLQYGSGNYTTVAQKTSPTPGEQTLVAVKKLQGARGKTQLNSIQRIRHGSFLACQDILSFQDSFIVAFEFLPLSLAEVAANPLLNEIKLASILGQIVQGLSYLEAEGLEHGRLSCSEILLSMSGQVKIWSYQDCQPITQRGGDIRALSKIIMELMQGYCKDGGLVGIDNLARWPDGSLAIDFLSVTTYAHDLAPLLNHPLLALAWDPRLLEDVVFLTTIWARRGYRYPA